MIFVFDTEIEILIKFLLKKQEEKQEAFLVFMEFSHFHIFTFGNNTLVAVDFHLLY